MGRSGVRGMIDLAANLRATYGTWENYQRAIALLPKSIQAGLSNPDYQNGGFAIAPTVLESFKNSEISSEDASSPVKACGCCTVHSLINEPSLLLSGANSVYIGRTNRTQQLAGSVLANPSRMKGKSSAERDRVCNEDLLSLIRVLEVQGGPRWKEIKRLSLKVRKGEDVKLLCYCAPLRCHGDAIALVINRLAAKVPVRSVIGELRSLIPANQAKLFGIDDEF
jgi:hypothetical protein